MQFLQRLWNILMGRAEVVVDRLERPEDKLNHFVNELTGQIDRMQRAVVLAIADEKKLRMQLEDATAKCADWERRARLAVEKSRDDLAREALQRQADCSALATTLRTSWESQKSETTKLKASLAEMRKRVDDAKRQYTLSLARYNAASSKQALARSLTDTSTGSSNRMLEDLNAKVLQLEAEAEAKLEINNLGADADLESQFARLEGKSNIDGALERLKASMQDSKNGTNERLDQVQTMKDKLNRAS